jgi:ribosomal protein S1
LLTDCDHFRIRGDVVSVSDDSAVIHVAQNVKAGKLQTSNLMLNYQETLEAEPGQFWEVYAKRQRYQLDIESASRIAVPSAAAAMRRPR